MFNCTNLWKGHTNLKVFQNCITQNYFQLNEKVQNEASRLNQIQTHGQTKLVPDHLTQSQNQENLDSESEISSIKIKSQRRKNPFGIKIKKRSRLDTIGQLTERGNPRQSAKQSTGGCITQSCLDNVKNLQFWMKGDFANAFKRIMRFFTFVSKSGKKKMYSESPQIWTV